MRNNPLITIGVTAFNARDSIACAVRSALAQDWVNTEILIVDDCSTDSTFAKISALAEKHRNIRVFKNERNSGVAASRNGIIREAKGDFIAFFDDDDESLPHRLTTQCDSIRTYEEKHPGSMVVCHAARSQFYPDGSERIELPLGAGAKDTAPHGKAVAQRVLYGRPSPHVFGSAATCSQMARTEVYKRLGGFDASFRRAEDTDFSVRAALAGAHFIGISEPLVRQTMTMGTEKRLEEEKKYALLLLEKHRNFLEGEGQYAFSRRWLEARYDYLQGHPARFTARLLSLGLGHPVQFLQRLFWSRRNLEYNRRLKAFHKNSAS